jgi:2-keto-4-pentenoate hydratase/2-oxohepta-3-ene-1,7-dioic acid hydratase in catechol pathway
MKIFCVGRNYALHAKELGNSVPDKPVIFMKPDTALLKSGEIFFLPAFSSDIHFETELIIRISKTGKGIPANFAHRYFDKVSVGIDFTARDIQQELKSKGLPWELAKAFDHSAVVGDWIPVDVLKKDSQELDFSLNINNKTVQLGNAAQMLFSISEIIAFVSQYFTLKAGDIIFTGTPEGVGKVQQGDVLEGFLEDLKCLEIRVK